MKDVSSRGYDWLAPYYDDIVGLVYGKEIFDAQIHFFHQIPPHANVLIIGGGTGWILPELFRLKPELKVCYIESSDQMIRLAEKKLQKGTVEFIHGTENDIEKESFFDVIITNFYLDGFSKKILPTKIMQMLQSLAPDGQWIITDFVETGKWKHSFLLWLMHTFLRYIVHHPNRKLVDWQTAYKNAGLRVIEEKTFYQGFIKTLIVHPEK
jgi:ubiquinone/menaquinone biosynthesis C-methylase UbiE